MSVWRVCERAELGKSGRVWELRKGQPLNVGRSTEVDIQVQSKTVENRHAVLEWNTKLASFAVRDLDSMNGTYVNNRPIRGGSVSLNHGDVVRFGYEKTHVFRVEETFPSPARTTPQHTAKTTPSNQTSPKKEVTPPTTTPPFSAAQAFSSPTPPVQFGSPAHNQTVILPPTYIHQQSPVPLVLPQFGYPGSPPVSLHPTPVGHVTIPQPSSAFHPISPTQFLQLSTPPPPPPVTSTPESPASVEELESSGGSAPKPQRSDGRRAVELSNSPNLSKVSKLYGRPSWAGDEQPTEKENRQEFEFVKPGSQILRDYDRRGRSPSLEDPPGVGGRPQTQRHSASEDLRVQAMSNSRECASPASTWVVDFDSNTLPRKKRPSRFDKTEHRPRSADPSPNRSGDPSPSRSPQIKKDLLPPSMNLKRSTSTRSPSSSPRRSPVMTRRPQGMTVRKSRDSGKAEGGGGSTDQALSRSKTVVKRPVSGGSTGSLARTKTTVKRTTTPTSGSGSTRVRRSSLDRALQASDMKEAKKTASSSGDGGGGAKERTKKRNNSTNETYVAEPASSSVDESRSQSDVSLSSSGQAAVEPKTPDTATLKSSSAVVMKTEGEKGNGSSQQGSARKQWSSEQAQATDGLMLASIEARIRRLSKLAHSSARQLSCLQRSLQDVSGVVVQSIPPTSPLGGQKGGDQRLPEWRFNKEGDSIFRGMRTIEKWLKDIQATVNSIQVGAPADDVDSGGVGVAPFAVEGTDYAAEDEGTEREVASILQDSSDVFYSFSDNEMEEL